MKFPCSFMYSVTFDRARETAPSVPPVFTYRTFGSFSRNGCLAGRQVYL